MEPDPGSVLLGNVSPGWVGMVSEHGMPEGGGAGGAGACTVSLAASPGRPVLELHLLGEDLQLWGDLDGEGRFASALSTVAAACLPPAPRGAGGHPAFLEQLAWHVGAGMGGGRRAPDPGLPLTGVQSVGGHCTSLTLRAPHRLK